MKNLSKYLANILCVLTSLILVLPVFAENKKPLDNTRLEKIRIQISHEGELTPIPELKNMVHGLESIIRSEKVTQISSTNKSLMRMRFMSLVGFFHVGLSFESSVQDPAYEIPFRAPYPFRPTLEAIDEAIEYLKIVENLSQGSFSLEQIWNSSEFQKMKDLLMYLPSMQANTKIKMSLPESKIPDDSKLSAERRLILDPVTEYAKLKKRLITLGENASFPEFSKTIDKLRADLSKPEIVNLYQKNSALFLYRRNVLQALIHVIDSNYPYRPTINAIMKALKFFDVVERTKYSEFGDSKVVEESWLNATKQEKFLEPLYHFDRYKYHWFSVIADSNLIVFPTVEPLDFMDLVKVRPVPIGFIGIETKTVWADRHFQTPLDFAYHDINHVRRMTGNLNGELKKARAKTEDQKLQVYKDMEVFVNTLLLKTQLPNKPSRADLILQWQKEMATMKIARAIIFEVLHESALAATHIEMIDDLLRTSNVPQSFEYLSLSPQPITNIETRRTDTGNISSGASTLLDHPKDQNAYVHYFGDRALSLLANVLNKMTHNFYDSAYNPQDEFIPVMYRTPETVVDAAEHLFKILNHPAPDRKTLLEWAYAKKGSPEKFIKYKGIIIPVDSEALYDLALSHNFSNILIPQSPSEIEFEVHSLNKQVHSIFGYSALGYQKPEALRTQLQKDFSKLDPHKTIINIGATPEGLGIAYEVAKSMGFETMGFVSKKFLDKASYYSAYVDRIFVVDDPYWGGYIPGTHTMTPTTGLFVRLSSSMKAYGGGEISKITMQEFLKTKKPIAYDSFEMNHQMATERAQAKGETPPTSFNSSVDELLPYFFKLRCEGLFL